MEEVHYWRMRVGQVSRRGRRLIACPSCGETGEPVAFPNGDQMILHAVRVIPNLIEMPRRHCYVRAGEAQAAEAKGV